MLNLSAHVEETAKHVLERLSEKIKPVTLPVPQLPIKEETQSECWPELFDQERGNLNKILCHLEAIEYILSHVDI